jgi:uncharacterized protein DUF6458
VGFSHVNLIRNPPAGQEGIEDWQVGQTGDMGLAVSLLIAAVGLILALAVHPNGTHQVDVNTVGWILFIVGLIGFILDLLLWSQWGPGYMRRTTVAEAGPGYPARRRAVGTRRTVVEEEDVDAPGPPPGY